MLVKNKLSELFVNRDDSTRKKEYMKSSSTKVIYVSNN